MRSLLLSLVTLFVFSALSSAEMQNVTVKGKAICHKQPMADIVVQLIEHNTLTFNELLMCVRTNKMGEFEVTGGTDEYGHINPFVRFYHVCDLTDEQKHQGCKRRVEFDVPKEHINGAAYDMTFVPLNINHADEKIEC